MDPVAPDDKQNSLPDDPVADIDEDAEDTSEVSDDEEGSSGGSSEGQGGEGTLRRSRRSNFGNRYEQAILKEKEVSLNPVKRNGTLLEGTLASGEEDSEEDDTDFRPPENPEGNKHSGSETKESDQTSSSDDSEDDSKSSKKEDSDKQEKAKSSRSRKDPLNSLYEQKRSLEELLDEVAQSKKLEGLKICSICLWDEYDAEVDAVVQCDSCGVSVHEQCYGVLGKELEETHKKDSDTLSSTETMPWFCDPCRFGERIPRCIACPNKYGAFKQTVKGDWIHSACARYLREIYFDDDERLSDAVVSDLPFARWGDRPCVVCEDVYSKNAGVTIQCETGMCRKFLHATCAMAVGSAAEMEPEMGYPLAVYCPDHTPKEDRASNRRCFLASLGMQRRHQNSLKEADKDERDRLAVAEEKQRETYLNHRKNRDLSTALQHSVRPLHASFALITKGHSRSEAFGLDPRPMVNPKPSVENARLSRPEFRPEFVAYVFKREKLIFEYLERMDHLKHERDRLNTSRGKFDPTRGKAGSKRFTMELKGKKDLLFNLLSPFMGHMDKKYLPALVTSSPKRRPTKSELDLKRIMKPIEPKCGTCGASSFPQRMVQCDDCRQWFHLKCLDPPLASMPSRRGVKWLCSTCVPTDEDSILSSSDHADNAEGRKRRRLQGKNPYRKKLDEVIAPPVPLPGQKRRGRKPGFRPQKKIKVENVEMAAAFDGSSEPGTSQGAPVKDPTAPRIRGRKKRVVEDKSGACCRCEKFCHNTDAVECDRCKRWYHFATCLSPPLLRSPRSRFYDWLCEKCSNSDADLKVLKLDDSE